MFAFDEAQGRVDILDCEGTVLAHVQLAIYEYPQLFFGRAVLNPFFIQLILVVDIALIQVQDFALGVVGFVVLL